MKCPHCKYAHGYVWNPNEKGTEDFADVIGEKGAFFVLPVKVESSPEQHYKNPKPVYACPACGILFIEVSPF
jgi:hypothetical protein